MERNGNRFCSIHSSVSVAFPSQARTVLIRPDQAFFVPVDDYASFPGRRNPSWPIVVLIFRFPTTKTGGRVREYLHNWPALCRTIKIIMIAKKLGKLYRVVGRMQSVIPHLFAKGVPPLVGQPLAALDQFLVSSRKLVTDFFCHDRKKNMLPPPSVLRARKKTGPFSALARRSFPK
jgi:hypothetical protein